MHDELVNRLKIAAEWAGKGFCITPSLCLEAADAIEELIRRCERGIFENNERRAAKGENESI